MKEKFLVQWGDRPRLQATAPKRIRTSPVSTIEFWNVEPKNPLKSDDSGRSITNSSEDLDILSFTSISNQTNSEKIDFGQTFKFAVKEIRKVSQWTVLVGDEVECYVSGEWSETPYQVGCRVTILGCMCCGTTPCVEDAEKMFGLESLNDTEENTVNKKENGGVNSHTYSRKSADDERRREMRTYFTESQGKGKKCMFVTNDKNYILVEDEPIAVTVFCTALLCVNKPYANLKIADIRLSYSDKNLAIGVITHSVTEKALIHKNFSLEFLIKQARDSIAENVVLMYICNIGEKEALNEALKLMRGICSLRDHELMAIEAERRVLSVLFNMKGCADVVCMDTVLEIKSGRLPKIEHRAQVILYSLMLRERTSRNIQPCLYYIPTRNFVRVDLKHQEVRSLLTLRNNVALSRGDRLCSCKNSESCQIVSRIQSLGTGHFLRIQWEAIEREERLCRIDTFTPIVFKNRSSSIVTFIFLKAPSSHIETCFDLLNDKFIKLCRGIVEEMRGNEISVRLSENIALSKEMVIYASFGFSDTFFKFMRFSLVYIAYPRYLSEKTDIGFSLPGEEYGFESSHEGSGGHIARVFESEGDSFFDDINEHFTSDEDTSVLKADILENSRGRDIYGASPEYERISTIQDINTLKIETEENTQNAKDEEYYGFCLHQELIPDIYKDEFLKLNEDQRSALLLSLSCRRYKVIHGMPGTGKSTLISLLIKILVHIGQRVLLICYTNLALTNIIEKLRGLNIYRAKKDQLTFENITEMRLFFDKIELVAGTCFSFMDPIYVNRKFDFCVIDEGSQIHLLLSLIPVSISSKFVVLGDHFQLKPLSRYSKDLSLSLFEYLLKEDHLKLRIQYRMGAEIMRLSNSLFYENQMRGSSGDSEINFVDTSQMDFLLFISSLEACTVLCYFNTQVEYVRKMTKCTVETVDRFQGSEDDKIVVVFDPVSKCEIMESNERLNVALTRARKHLVLVGNKEKMMKIQVLKSLIDIL